MLQAPSLLSLGACAVAAGVAAHVARRALLHRRSGTPALGFDAALARLSGSSVEDLILIVDFDRTLTDGDSAQCHDVIGATSLVPESLRAGFAPLLDFSDPAKVPYKGDAWWVRANELLLTHASRVLTPETVRRLVHEAPLFGTSTQPMQLRPGAARLLARLSELDVPVLIVSAGFADIIAAFLAARAVPLGSNVRVCSNLLVHDAASGQLTGIEPSPPITGCNKQLTFERNRDWFTTTHRRRRDAS
uniref:5'-nucleotidase n=1 Tax=Emiliania huxleyi TaxID=2903 RepID=A0A6V2LV99_EMIHU